MKRPTGVLVIGILGIIGGILGIIYSIGVFTFGGVATAVGAAGVGGFAMVAGWSILYCPFCSSRLSPSSASSSGPGGHLSSRLSPTSCGRSS
jgi:hypothetical protein